MHRVPLLAAVLCAAVTAGPAFAQTTGNELFASCRASANNAPMGNDGFRHGMCMGIVSSVFNLNAMGMLQLENRSPFCSGANITYGQMMKVVVNFMEHNPQHLNLPMEVLALRAFVVAWPCR